jgi:hypothetical protein
VAHRSFLYVKGSDVDIAKVIRDFLLILPFCLALSPLGMILVGIIGESRMIPMSPDKQFLSFWPGDGYLAVGVAIFWAIARNLPNGSHWSNSTRFRLAVVVVWIVVATALTFLEWKGGIYPTRAIFSPTKLYHNGLLYIGYGSIAVTSVVTVLARAPWKSEPVLWPMFLVATICFVRWGVWVVQDSTLTRDTALYKARHAHVADWTPVWDDM